jgi:thiamine monophosphate kinase
MTHEVFYNKLFPVIAHVNGYYKKNNDVSNRTDSRELKSLNDASNYRIPTVNWHKQLRPVSDNDMMDVLDKLEGLGLPVTLRALAASGGVNIESLFSDYEEDQRMRKRLEDMKSKFAQGEQTTDSGDEFALSSVTNPHKIKKIPVLSRDFSNVSEIVGQTKTGKKKAILNQKKANTTANDAIVKAHHKLQDPNFRREVSKRPGQKRNIYTGDK